MTQFDLKHKNIPTELVVVSACETGYGEIVEGEGSMSLSKGFFHAGAKSAVVSLWPVDDCTTAIIMEYFYKHLSQGLRKDQALRNAKIDFRKYADKKQAHPYYWAGFIVIGDCSAIWPASKVNLALITVIFLLVISLFISCRNRIKTNT